MKNKKMLVAIITLFIALLIGQNYYLSHKSTKETKNYYVYEFETQLDLIERESSDANGVLNQSKRVSTAIVFYKFHYLFTGGDFDIYVFLQRCEEDYNSKLSQYIESGMMDNKEILKCTKDFALIRDVINKSYNVKYKQLEENIGDKLVAFKPLLLN